jgi:SCP-2 sterol transfer family
VWRDSDSPTRRRRNVIAYLSDAWIDALDAALGSAAGLCALAPLVVEQIVTETPTGTVRYRITIDDEGACARRSGDTEHEPDLRFTTDYPTAVAIASGHENAQTALAAGRLRIGGAVEALTGRADAWTALADASAALRAETTFQ